MAMGIDFFGGWTPSDIDLLGRYQQIPVEGAREGEVMDWLGIRTHLSHHAWVKIPENGRIDILGLPVPSDMIHAETIEYIALVVAIERALEHDKGSFTVLELGASYGPWVTAAGLLASRARFPKIHMRALEASSESVPHIAAHAELNGLSNRAGIRIDPIHAAVHVSDEDVYFPRVNVSHDNGAQVSTVDKKLDYRGLSVAHDRVRGLSLGTICRDLSEISYVHLDLQGAEEKLLADEPFLETLSTKVGTFFLATQSRYIEGLALRSLSQRGWVLVRERPTTYAYNDRTSDVNGWTLRDGAQLWLNPRFGKTHLNL